jgi:hypothetical protein
MIRTGLRGDKIKKSSSLSQAYKSRCAAVQNEGFDNTGLYSVEAAAIAGGNR